MKPIITPNGGGKTFQLISIALDTGQTLVVRDKASERLVRMMTEETYNKVVARKLRIITWHDVLDKSALKGQSHKGLLFDDVDEFLSHLTNHISQVSHFSFTRSKEEMEAEEALITRKTEIKNTLYYNVVKEAMTNEPLSENQIINQANIFMRNHYLFRNFVAETSGTPDGPAPTKPNVDALFNEFRAKHTRIFDHSINGAFYSVLWMYRKPWTAWAKEGEPEFTATLEKSDEIMSAEYWPEQNPFEGGINYYHLQAHESIQAVVYNSLEFKEWYALGKFPAEDFIERDTINLHLGRFSMDEERVKVVGHNGRNLSVIIDGRTAQKWFNKETAFGPKNPMKYAD